MNTPYRTSPLESVIKELNPAWGTLARMRMPLSIPGEDAATRDRLALTDLSFLPRFGLKGPAAAEWLASRGIPVPGVNRWADLPGGGLVARLGNSEFFVEDGLDGDEVTVLQASLGRGIDGVAPVFRQDAALVLTGRDVNILLVQACNVNFKSLGMDERHVVMTSMTGVSVLVIPGARAGVPVYRIWCDGTFGPYLWKTLLQIAEESGGAAIGVNNLLEMWRG